MCPDGRYTIKRRRPHLVARFHCCAAFCFGSRLQWSMHTRPSPQWHTWLCSMPARSVTRCHLLLLLGQYDQHPAWHDVHTISQASLRFASSIAISERQSDGRSARWAEGVYTSDQQLPVQPNTCACLLFWTADRHGDVLRL